ncbi:MAG: ABC transporter substrate-binding protein [Candidatus Omnitrophica bacterium]|nr:ABC transporter substrate-binding protein [Candidatus Omnitrophota bacterium]MBU4479087.1 ABC transporter substrate-binding protein [Candidatus Omnitrophota bacterium]MCG2703008.1 ABC transporter substrate-binding protein [Candidatus Omnitrophota bacterium]
MKKKERSQGPEFTRREFLKNMGIAAGTACFAGLEILSPEQIFAQVLVPKEINIGTFAPSHCAVPFVYARLKGYYKDENLNVNLINYPDMPSIAKDLAGGKLDFGQLITNLPLVMHTGSKPFESAVPMVILAVTGVNGAALMVRKGANITSPADFKGKTLSNHSKLSVHHLINRMFLEHHKIDYEKDIQFKITELDNVVDAMKNAEVDAFVMPEPKDALVEHLGLADVFMLSKYIWPNHPCCVLTAKREYFDKNKGLAETVARAITRAALSANEAATREEIIDVLQSSPDYKYDKVPKAVLMKAFTPGRSDFYPFPYQSMARLIIEKMKEYKLLPAETNNKQLAEDVFLSDFSRKIIKDLGATPPKSNYRPEKILGVEHKYS